MSTDTKAPTDIGWPDLSELKRGAFRVLGEVLDENSDHTIRDRLQAASMVKSMDETNLKLAEFRDKQERLDSGRPTEISDIGSLGVAASDLANRIGAVIGNRAGDDPRAVRVVEGSEAEVRRLEDRAEPCDVDPEAVEGA